MEKRIRILLVEDSEADAIVILHEFTRAGYQVQSRRVDGLQEVKQALASQDWDVVISDYLMPDFTGPDALSILKECGLDLPFIMVSGVLGEDAAVGVMRAGAHDYLVKGRLQRLIPAVEREIGEAEVRRERKKIDEALRESERRYRQIVETASEGIVAADEDSTLTFVNDRMASLLGYSVQEMHGRKYEEFIFEEELQDQGQRMELRKQGKSETYERRFRRRDGSELWSIVSAAPLFDSEGRYSGSFAMITDITERRRTEEALRQSEERLKLIYEYAPDAYYLSDTNGILLSGNRAAEVLTGYSREELIGESLLERSLLLPSQLNRAAFLLSQSAIGRPTGPEEFILKRKDGKEVPVEVSTYPMTINGQTLVLGIARNITERKEAERTRALLATGIEDLSEIIMLTDQTSRIQYVNQAVERITGFSKERALGSPIKRVLLTPDLFILNAIHDAFKKGTPWKGQTKAKKADGGEFTMEAAVAPVRDKDGSVLSCALVIRDITQEEKVKERLIRSEKMESLGTLAGGIAHDFNNILSSILGYTELVMDDIPKGSLTRQNLEQVLLAGKRGKDLVKQILAFSRQEKQERGPVKVKQVVEETTGFLRASVPASVEMRLDLLSSAIVMANPTQISQVVMNLCSNAVQAMQNQQGVLAVSLEDKELDAAFVQGHSDLRPGPYLKLTVSDTGHGIDPAILGRIFDPFFTTKEKGLGTGMGLPVVHGIVKSLGGEITVYSKPGRGTTFSVYLPVSGAPQQTEAKKTAPLPLGRERILFVDDEGQIVNMASQILAGLGYSVLTTTSPLEALAAFRAHPEDFDLIITDMTMPNMTGDSLAEELKRIRPDVPILLCTGFSKRISEETTRSLEVEECLMKPLSKRELAEAVRRALDRVRTGE